MKEFIQSFSNRDIALGVWSLIMVVGVSFIKGIGESIVHLAKAFFQRQILISFISMLVYVSFIVCVLYLAGFWDVSQLKDTIYWTFGVAFTALVNISKFKEASHFRELIISALKWTILVEFVVGFYTFGLITELILLPSITFLFLLQIVAKQKEEHQQVANATQYVINAIGFVLLAAVCYKTVHSFQELPTLVNLKSLLLTSILTILYLPYIYCLALYCQYEVLFVRITFLTNKENLQKALKSNILRVANLNINSVKAIANNIHKNDFYYEKDFSRYVKSLVKGKMDPMSTSGLIDGRNVELWERLSAAQEIEIRREDREDYLTFSQGKKSIIHVPNHDVNSDSFTHELLHIDLREKEVFIGASIKNYVATKPTLTRILSDELLEHIGNCLNHIKILTPYLSMGYYEGVFISDYSVNKLPISDAKALEDIIRRDRKDKIYHSKMVDYFIGKYFAARACSNSQIDYRPSLNALRRADNALYKILDDFMDRWIQFDCDDKHPITGSYHLLVFDFIDQLDEWTTDKRFI
jgi:hypothetical protein